MKNVKQQHSTKVQVYSGDHFSKQGRVHTVPVSVPTITSRATYLFLKNKKHC